MKNDNPSTANGRPKTSPKRPIRPGHNRPISKLSTVPDTAPIANNTADTFDHRFARRRAVRSSRRIPRRCITKIIVGNATPKHARMMCQPNETAICSRAGNSSAARRPPRPSPIHRDWSSRPPRCYLQLAVSTNLTARIRSSRSLIRSLQRCASRSSPTRRHMRMRASSAVIIFSVAVDVQWTLQSDVAVDIVSPSHLPVRRAEHECSGSD